MADPLPPARERGAALLTVLLLVAVMSVVTATLLERLTIATRLTGNAGALDQVRAYTLSAEALAAARIGDLIAADQIGRAHVCTPGTNVHLVCRLLLEKK